MKIHEVQENLRNTIAGKEAYLAILNCLHLKRDDVEKHSKKWTWENCWKIEEEE